MQSHRVVQGSSKLIGLQATATGALLQFRILGGALGVAVETAILHAYVHTNIGIFQLDDQALTGLSNGLSVLYKTLFAVALLQLVAVAMVWDRNLIIAEQKPTDNKTVVVDKESQE